MWQSSFGVCTSLVTAANMIDKTVILLHILVLYLNYVSTAPSTFDVNSTKTNISLQDTTDTLTINRTSNISSTSEPILNSDSENNFENISSTGQTISDRIQLRATLSSQLQATAPSSKNTLKPRKNKNDLYFCCTDDNIETATVPYKTNKQRERNTKTPSLKRRKNTEIEEPIFERRPALLLRFFPDGTAVLISKFQLHLHVKPKEIKFEQDDSVTEDSLEFNPGLILNDGKNYEVTYKRLEAVPSSREKNEFDLDESEERYSEDIESHDHELITTVATPLVKKTIPDENKLSPVKENTVKENTAKENTTKDNKTNMENYSQTTSTFTSRTNETEKLTSTDEGNPFFMMTSEEMSSLQQQYDPGIALPLKATTTESLNLKNTDKPDLQTTLPSTSSESTSTEQTLITTTSSRTSTLSSTTTTKCLSFKNQLSLALSTEDNIDNALLKRYIFPTLDCNNDNSDTSNSVAKIESFDSTTRPTTTSLPIITRLPPEPTNTQSYTRNNLVPYLASQFSNDPSKPNVVVVTSLPVLIDLKSTRNQLVTDVPAWREVTVGVVRNQQGQPLKPKYNNWTAHLRSLRKKTEHKFWNDFTTPKPNVRSRMREPIQQAPSQVNRAFWEDMQRQKKISDQRNKETVKPDMNGNHRYLTSPPREYLANNEKEFQFWRIRTPTVPNRWNVNGNGNRPDYAWTNEPLRNGHPNYENVQSRENPQYNRGDRQQSSRRW